MTKKYLKTLLSVQVQCTGQLLKVQEEDELICTLYSCIHAWAKKKGYDALEIMEMLVAEEKVVQAEIERNRLKQIAKERKLLYND